LLFPEGTSTDGERLVPFQTVPLATPLRSRSVIVPTTLAYKFIDGLPVSPDFSPLEKHKATLYGIKAVSPNSYAKGEERPYGNTVYNRTNGIPATGAARGDWKI
jgi:1-acyl-sn-glycerol-3-phosphate acyltransferase